MTIAPDASLNFADMLRPFCAVNATFCKQNKKKNIYCQYTMCVCILFKQPIIGLPAYP